MTHRERTTAMCPACREPVEVLPDGRLADHRAMPGVGTWCPRHNIKERLR